WRFAFIGPVDASFRARAERLLAQRPDLVSKVVFTGPINDRATLYDWLDRARLSCLPSLSESFSFALIEALAFRHHLLVSPRVSSAHDIPAGGRFGSLLPPELASAWADALARAVDGAWSDAAEVQAAAHHARERFAWSRQIDALGGRLGLVPPTASHRAATGAAAT